ncbi:MAG TPA: SAM-dependent methyltransferase [Kofleriaceae bacterium]|jgi:SAM-dependent methyltransferase
MDPATRARWSAALADRAREYWTPARTRELTGGKDLALLPADAPHLLRALGLLDGDARMPPQRVRKYLQINHVARDLRPALDALRARHASVRLLDAGCGRSYLTLLLAYLSRGELSIVGIDRNAAVIDECRRRAALAGLSDSVSFLASPLESFDASGFHGIFALHACDTATCDAIALGVAAGADLIAVAPCCQAELARAWSALAAQDAASPFSAVWSMPHLRRETAAHLTDVMRVLLLRARGYTTVSTEFIASDHTPKNTLIRALRGAIDPTARAAYDALVAATGAGLALASRL